MVRKSLQNFNLCYKSKKKSLRDTEGANGDVVSISESPGSFVTKSFKWQEVKET